MVGSLNAGELRDPSLLGIHGGEGDGAISNALRSASVEHEVVEYPGVGHGFLSDRRSGFDPAAAQDAWQRVDALLSRSL